MGKRRYIRTVLKFLLIALLLVYFTKPQTILAQSPNPCGGFNQQCCVTNPGYGHSYYYKCNPGLICQNGLCVNSDSNPLKNDCIDTAIGCVPIEQQGFVVFILKWAIGIAGGIAFILIVLASFQIMTSQGDPKRLQAGKELLSSAIMGLLLLIFSVFILRIIGVNILQIPGLS